MRNKQSISITFILVLGILIPFYSLADKNHFEKSFEETKTTLKSNTLVNAGILSNEQWSITSFGLKGQHMWIHDLIQTSDDHIVFFVQSSEGEAIMQKANSAGKKSGVGMGMVVVLFRLTMEDSRIFRVQN